MKALTIKGIKIKFHFSTMIIVGFVGFYAATYYKSSVPNVSIWELILVGLINGIVILFSILIHELCHSIMAQRYGLRVSEIELYLFGGVSKIEEEPKTPKSEFIIAGVGPLSSLLIGGGGLLIVFILTPINLPAWLIFTLFYSGIMNIGLGFFNLLLAFPMDGGRILRAIIWKKRNNILSATKTATKIGKFFGYSLMILGSIQMILGWLGGLGGLFGGFWLILMGLFLISSAKKSYYSAVNEGVLSNITIKDLLSSQKLVIPFVIQLNEALRDYFTIFKQNYYPVVNEGEFIGIVHLDDIKRIPLEQRSELIVGDVMKKFSEFPSIYEDFPGTGKDVIKILNDIELEPRVLVVREKEHQNIVGLIDEEELIKAVKSWELNTLSL